MQKSTSIRSLLELNAYWVGLSFMWNALHPIVLPALLLSLQGCGMLYTNIVRSESRDFNNTPVGSKSFSLIAYRIQVPLFLPFSRLTRASAQWDNDKIDERAKESGMTRIYYTDFKTQEILMGTLRRQTIIVYGD